MKTGPSRNPASSIHVVPVISPLPFIENQPAKTWSFDPLPRGRIAVTPVRTGPLPTFSAPSPEMSVVIPTSTPATSVIALSGPGVPSNGMPRSRARGFVCASGMAAKRTKRDNVASVSVMERVRMTRRMIPKPRQPDCARSADVGDGVAAFLRSVHGDDAGRHEVAGRTTDGVRRDLLVDLVHGLLDLASDDAGDAVRRHVAEREMDAALGERLVRL